jgi:hypothetical protein
MSKKGGKAPKTPDYSGLAKTDAEEQRKTAEQLTQSNRPTQIDPYGNRIDWTKDANGNWTQQTSLNPTLQAANQDTMSGFRNAMGTVAGQGGFNAPGAAQYNPMNNVGMDAATRNFENGSFTNTAGAIGNFDRTQGDQVAHDMYSSAMSRLLPDQQRAQQGLDNQLRQQGLQPGTEAYDRAYKNMLTAHGDVDSKAALDATQAGYNTAQNIYNTNLGGQNQRYNQLAGTYGINKNQQQQAFQNQVTRQNQIMAGNTQNQQEQAQRYSQALTNYGIPMQRAGEFNQLMGSLPGGQFPGFSGATGYSPASMSDAANSAFQANMGKYSGGQSKKGSGTNAAAGLAGSLFGK